MTEKEMRKLSRADLLEMLLEQSQELQSLREQLNTAEAALQQKEIRLNTAGSIAQAALQLNGVFESAQAACRQYTDNIRLLSARQEEICRQIELESQQKAAQRLAQAEKASAALEAETKIHCAEMLRKAKAESQACWDALSDRLEAFYREHSGLKDLLSVSLEGNKQTK